MRLPYVHRLDWLYLCFIMAAMVGLYLLWAHLPSHYVPAFWDEAELVGNLDGSAQQVESTYSYVKIGYAAILSMFVDQYGPNGVLVYNCILFGVLLCLGWLFTWKEWWRPDWRVGVVYTALCVSFPFVHKYIGMASPTLQSMILWFLLLRCADMGLSRWKWQWVMWVLLFWLTFTEGPKGLVFGSYVLLSILVYQRVSGWFFSWCVVVGSSMMGVTVVGILNPSYWDSFRQFLQPSFIWSLRPALCWNFLSYLLLLGGGSILLQCCVSYKCNLVTEIIQKHKYGLIGLVSYLCLSSFVIWPRPARMFAVVMPFMLWIGVRMVVASWWGSRVTDYFAFWCWAPKRLGWYFSFVALSCILVLGEVAYRLPSVGQCFATAENTGLKWFEQNRVTWPKDPYVVAVDVPWVAYATRVKDPAYLLARAVDSPLPAGTVGVFGYPWSMITILDQWNHGSTSFGYLQMSLARMSILSAGMRDAVEIPAPWYGTIYALSETTFEDGELWLIRRYMMYSHAHWLIGTL